MDDDVRRLIYGVVIVFVLMIAVWFGLIYVSACGLTLTCLRAAQPVERTPIPTLIPATLPAGDHSGRTEFNKCQVAAADLIGAWVTAGHPESGPFPFTDVNGASCAGTFEEDVRPLFVDSNFWYPGALACSSCHNPRLLTTNDGLDLSTYDGMTMGAKRTDENDKGEDIFGDGVWADSILYEWLYVQKHLPLARPPELAAEGPVIYAGTRLSGSAATPNATATP